MALTLQEIKIANKENLKKIIDLLRASNPQQFTDEEAEELLGNLHSHEEYTDTEVEAMFENLTPEELEMYQNLINDNATSTTRLWSSKKITEAISQAILDSNAYADGILGQCSSIELEYVQTLPDIGDSNKVYILESADITLTPHSLNFYNVNTSAWIEIGDLNINLDSYATTEYVDTKLADKANSSEVLAINKVQTTTGSETNDTVYSSQLTKDELDKKINVTDITTTIDSTSTDNQLPSAKSVYSTLSSNLKNTKIMYFDFTGEFDYNTTLGVNNTNTITEVVRAFANYIINTYGKGQYTILEFTSNNNSSVFSKSLPTNGESCIGTVKYTPWQLTNRIQVILTNVLNGNNYIGTLNNSDTDDIVWQRICTTKVADVPRTIITSENKDINLNQNCAYEVINGICYVSLWGFQSTVTGQQIICSSMPKTKITKQSMCCYGSEGHTGAAVFVTDNDNGNLFVEINVADQTLYGAFSYPVAE